MYFVNRPSEKHVVFLMNIGRIWMKLGLIWIKLHPNDILTNNISARNVGSKLARQELFPTDQTVLQARQVNKEARDQQQHRKRDA